MGPWQIGFIVLCVAGGACLGLMPFLLEYRVLAKLLETRELEGVVSQIRNLESVAAQVTSATARWNNVQEEADKTAAAAKSIAEGMGAEVKAFTEFMQRANESEKATLRLEVEKLHRAENDWLQVLVRILDHVYALNQGAIRSGQPNLIQQMASFQNACRDTTRRVGLTPFAPNAAEPFDPQRHQVMDNAGQPPAGALIAETIATGYTFQGRLIRPALVRVGDGAAGEPAPTEAAKTADASQSQLSLKPA